MQGLFLFPSFLRTNMLVAIYSRKVPKKEALFAMPAQKFVQRLRLLRGAGLANDMVLALAKTRDVVIGHMLRPHNVRQHVLRPHKFNNIY